VRWGEREGEESLEVEEGPDPVALSRGVGRGEGS